MCNTYLRKEPSLLDDIEDHLPQNCPLVAAVEALEREQRGLHDQSTLRTALLDPVSHDRKECLLFLAVPDIGREQDSPKGVL